MDNMTLVALLEADREMLMGSLCADRSPQAAQTAVEKELDRITLRYAEQAEEPAVVEAAQLTLKALRSALPLMDAVGEVRRWEQTALEPVKRKPWTRSAVILLLLGLLLNLSALTALAVLSYRFVEPLILLEASTPALLSMAVLFFAGLRYDKHKPEPAKVALPAAREEFLIDPEKVWHQLRGMLLLADNALENVERREMLKAQALPAPAPALPEPIDTAGTELNPRQAELFSGLLEVAYARDDADIREMAENVAFYLHGVGVEVTDYAPGREACFEFLPAPTSGTLRPALMSGDKVIKKGLAAK